MIQEFKDEVLDTSGQSDNNPRYRIRDNNGTILQDDVQITLKTPVTQEGTAINKAMFDELQGDIYVSSQFLEPTSVNVETYETNLYEYSKSTSPIANTCQAIAYGNGTRIVSYGTNIAKTTDNINWVSKEFTIAFKNIIFDGTRFVAITYADNSSTWAIYTSEDNGETWQWKSDLSSSSSASYTKIDYKDNVYIVIYKNVTLNRGTIYSSSDLATWSERIHIGDSNTGGSFTDVAHNDEVFVAVTMGDFYPYYSSDGITWNSNTSIPKSNFIAWIKDRFFAGGKYSFDGLEWSKTIGYDISSKLYGAYYDGVKYITQYSSDFFFSYDGVTFSRVDLSYLSSTSSDLYGSYLADGTIYAFSGESTTTQKLLKFTLLPHSTTYNFDVPLKSYKDGQIVRLTGFDTRSQNIYININNLGSQYVRALKGPIDRISLYYSNGEFAVAIPKILNWNVSYTKGMMTKHISLPSTNTKVFVTAGNSRDFVEVLTEAIDLENGLSAQLLGNGVLLIKEGSFSGTSVIVRIIVILID